MEGFAADEAALVNGHAGIMQQNGDTPTLASLIAKALPVSQAELTSTRFPYLDTHNHTASSGVKGELDVRPTYQRKLLSESEFAEKGGHLQAYGSLQRYGSFILGLTGEDTALIRCMIRSKDSVAWRGHVHVCRQAPESNSNLKSSIRLQALKDDFSIPAGFSHFAFVYDRNNESSSVGSQPLGRDKVRHYIRS